MYFIINFKTIITRKAWKSLMIGHKFHTKGESNVNNICTPLFTDKSYYNSIATYSILKDGNNYKSIHEELQINQAKLLKIYKTMVSLNTMDTMLYECQRQGRISFYMTNFGEEAVQIGSAAALCSNDLIYAQYRESGILLWRGFDYGDFIDQCFGNLRDKNKGRQMPVHYGSRSLNFVTISSPLATQLPQAVGAAYGLKYRHKDLCVVCYFGEGAASEGDTHAAFNFAATLECPVLFICRNNGYAISTPTHQQYKGDGIAGKGPAYGINTIRVDGNDALAMFQATKSARDYVIKKKRPVLIEAITYRVGHHSTSDDSTAYRSNKEIREYLNNTPILRLKQYLENIGLWNEEEERKWCCSTKNQIITAIGQSEKNMKPKTQDLFSDVYEKVPNHLQKQLNSMRIHFNKYIRNYSEL